MPYGGTTSSQDARIERCVTRLVRQGRDKRQAIRICKASVMKADKKGGR